MLEDLYSVSGDALIPQKERFDVHAFEESSDVRESIRLPIALAKDAPPIGTALAAFAQPTITAVTPAGKRLDAEGVMAVTLIYLPMDSDIPMAIHTREPFAMTFPIETTEDAQVQARVIEATPGPATSDRAGGALRCGAACRQARRASARRGDRRGAAARRPAGAWLRARLAGQGRIPLGRRPSGCASRRRNCIPPERARCWRFEMTPRARKRPFVMPKRENFVSRL